MLKHHLMVTSIATAIALTGCGGGGGSDTTNTQPTLRASNFQAADYVIGQPGFTTSDDPSLGGGLTATDSGQPYAGAGFGNGVLYLADYDHERVRGFNSMPTSNNPTPDFVIGQPDFSSSLTGTEANEMSGPQSPVVAGNKLFITEYENHRVTIYSPAPTSGPASATLVLGQNDFGTMSVDCSASGMFSPEVLTVAGDKLIVSDSENNRVLIWNSIPTVNGQAADVVLGQADFDNCDENRGSTVAADTLYQPTGLWSDGTRLVVQDSDNNRILIWNTFPTSNGQPADLVLGQGDFSHSTANDDDQDGSNDGMPTNRTLSDPYDGIASDGDWLMVTDTSNHRILIWTAFPTSNFQSADIVLGQATFDAQSANDDDQDGSQDGAPSARTFNDPSGLTLAQDRYLIVSDNENRRYLVFDLAKQE